MKADIIFFSRTGHTRQAAETLARCLGGKEEVIFLKLKPEDIPIFSGCFYRSCLIAGLNFPKNRPFFRKKFLSVSPNGP
jgi:hypothetical protein